MPVDLKLLVWLYSGNADMKYSPNILNKIGPIIGAKKVWRGWTVKLVVMGVKKTKNLTILT